MKRSHIIIAVLAVLAALWAGWSARTYFAIDDCLDAGGRWSAQGRCEGVFSEA